MKYNLYRCGENYCILAPTETIAESIRRTWKDYIRVKMEDESGDEKKFKTLNTTLNSIPESLEYIGEIDTNLVFSCVLDSGRNPVYTMYQKKK